MSFYLGVIPPLSHPSLPLLAFPPLFPSLFVLSPLPLIQLRDLGERCKLPSGSGQSTANKRFFGKFW